MWSTSVQACQRETESSVFPHFLTLGIVSRQLEFFHSRTMLGKLDGECFWRKPTETRANARDNPIVGGGLPRTRSQPMPQRNSKMILGRWRRALVPRARQRFASLSKTPLKGKSEEPRKTRCSSVCGSPSSACAHDDLRHTTETDVSRFAVFSSFLALRFGVPIEKCSQEPQDTRTRRVRALSIVRTSRHSTPTTLSQFKSESPVPRLSRALARAHVIDWNDRQSSGIAQDTHFMRWTHLVCPPKETSRHTSVGR